MKIDVVVAKKRENFEGPIYLLYKTIRVPKDVKILNLRTVKRIVEERKKRKEILQEWWIKKYGEVNDVVSDYALISWSPIMNVDTLDFL